MLTLKALQMPSQNGSPHNPTTAIRKKELAPAEKQEAIDLKAAIAQFNAQRPAAQRISQKLMAHEMGVSESAMSHYLNGFNRLNPQVATVIKRLFGIEAKAYSPRLHESMGRDDLPKGCTRLSAVRHAWGEITELLNQLERSQETPSTGLLMDIALARRGMTDLLKIS